MLLGIHILVLGYKLLFYFMDRRFRPLIIHVRHLLTTINVLIAGTLWIAGIIWLLHVPIFSGRYHSILFPSPHYLSLNIPLSSLLLSFFCYGHPLYFPNFSYYYVTIITKIFKFIFFSVKFYSDIIFLWLQTYISNKRYSSIIHSKTPLLL